MEHRCAGLALLLATLTIGGDRIAAAREASDSPPAVTVQIHDYVHLPPATLSGASGLVSRIYSSIGVRTEWLAPMRQEPFGASPSRGSRARSNPPSASNPPHVPIAQITVIVLTPEMTQRGHLPESILGFAAVATDGSIGRIAYVIYDRVEQEAAIASIDESDLFGLVMAHEMGHLLLGPGSQSDSGLMKGYWDREDLHRFRTVTPRFSTVEGKEIRAALSGVGLQATDYGRPEPGARSPKPTRP